VIVPPRELLGPRRGRRSPVSLSGVNVTTSAATTYTSSPLALPSDPHADVYVDHPASADKAAAERSSGIRANHATVAADADQMRLTGVSAASTPPWAPPPASAPVKAPSQKQRMEAAAGRHPYRRRYRRRRSGGGTP